MRARFLSSLVAALTAVALSGIGVPDASAGPATVTHDPVLAAAGWLTTQFVDGSHLPTPTGDHVNYDPYQGSYSPSYGANADAIFGLAAAGVGGAKIKTLISYLAANVSDYADLSKAFGGPFDGSIGKSAVAAIAAGADPVSLGGHNLPALLKADECTAVGPICAAPGAAANLVPYGSSISESFVILAEARTAGAYKPSAAALAYFLSLQCASGGFTGSTTKCGSGAAEVDATSYALMALAAAGGHAAEASKAVGWLRSQRAAAGYWQSQGGPNVNSTGLAAAALGAAGEDVSTARSWLLAQQIPAGAAGAGALRYANGFVPTSLKTTSPSVLATAQALTALGKNGSLATVATTAQSEQGASLFEPVATSSPASVVPGGRQTITGRGFAAGEHVQAVLHSQPMTIGSGVVAPDGSVSFTYVLPKAVASGAHAVVLTGADSGLRASTSFTVTAAPVATTSAGPVPPTTAPNVAVPSADATTALAATGTNGPTMVWLGVIGCAVLIAGCGLVVIGRRRAG